MTGDAVRLRVRDGCGIIRLSRPPHNLIDHALTGALGAALDRLMADPGVAGIVLLAEGAHFSAGIDLGRVDLRGGTPDVAPLLGRIAAARLPVVAVLEGPALGAGAALALAAGHRLATPAGAVAFPEARAGLLPVPGTIGRLVALAGGVAAVGMLSDGARRAPAAAQAAGLIDGIVTGDAPSAALAWLARLARGASPRPPHADPPAAVLDAIAAARATIAPGAPAAAALALDAVEGWVLLPASAAAAREADAAEAAAADPAGRALRHLLAAERRVTPRLLHRPAPGAAPLATAAGAGVVAALSAARDRACRAMAAAGLDPGRGLRALAGRGAATDPAARRLIGAGLAESLRLAAAGQVARPSDADALAVLAGFPAATGGPVHLATVAGALRLAREMAVWAAQDPVWAVPPTLIPALLDGGTPDDAVSRA